MCNLMCNTLEYLNMMLKDIIGQKEFIISKIKIGMLHISADR